MENTEITKKRLPIFITIIIFGLIAGIFALKSTFDIRERAESIFGTIVMQCNISTNGSGDSVSYEVVIVDEAGNPVSDTQTIPAGTNPTFTFTGETGRQYRCKATQKVTGANYCPGDQTQFSDSKFCTSPETPPTEIPPTDDPTTGGGGGGGNTGGGGGGQQGECACGLDCSKPTPPQSNAEMLGSGICVYYTNIPFCFDCNRFSGRVISGTTPFKNPLPVTCDEINPDTSIDSLQTKTWKICIPQSSVLGPTENKEQVCYAISENSLSSDVDSESNIDKAINQCSCTRCIDCPEPNSLCDFYDDGLGDGNCNDRCNFTIGFNDECEGKCPAGQFKGIVDKNLTLALTEDSAGGGFIIPKLGSELIPIRRGGSISKKFPNVGVYEVQLWCDDIGKACKKQIPIECSGDECGPTPTTPCTPPPKPQITLNCPQCCAKENEPCENNTPCCEGLRCSPEGFEMKCKSQ